jgi:hypothetical protein
VVENGALIGVISIRDLLSEAVVHHEKVISELERERLTMLRLGRRSAHHQQREVSPLVF